MGLSNFILRRWRRFAAVLVSLAVVGTAIVSAPAGAATAPQWSVQPMPPILGYMHAVSCPSKNSCVAVGTLGVGQVNVAAHWNGTSWTTRPISGGVQSELFGVSCTTPQNCIAVGAFVAADDSPGLAARPFAMRWNGLAWVIQPTPNVGSGSLSAVSCSASNACTAVGQAGGTTLVERWNGSAWRVQSTPQPPDSRTATLNGVSCTSRTACVAVGSYDTPLGGLWTLAQHWNGTGWTIQPTPSPPPTHLNRLSGVSCTSASTCTAVGSSGDLSLAIRWNGTAWTTQPTPNQSGQRYNPLSAVSCTSASACTAVGHYNDPALPTPAAWRWDGVAWTIETLPVPSGTQGGQLSGVSCTSPIVCTAVGLAYSDGPVSTANPLVERYS